MKRNDISDGGPVRSFLRTVDFYRRVPRDLTEATSLGVTMSMLALFIMVTLFLAETLAFARTNFVTEIALDDNVNPQIKINFNLTFRELQCDYLSVDVLDSLGTNKQNITKNVEKWHLDGDGHRRIYAGRNREQRQVQHEEHSEDEINELWEVDEDGVAQLTADNFKEYISKNEMAFINFFAPWCVWCQRLHPTWEKFSREATKEQHMPLTVASVDCVENNQLCRENKIFAFPTLRWYANGEPMSPDYKMDRTVNALLDFAKRKFEMNERFKDWEKRSLENNKNADQPKKTFSDWHGRPDYVGCQVSGHIMVNRVKGNFHIEARSVSHNLNPAMANLSHVINHLSFGDTEEFINDRKFKRYLKGLPKDYQEFTPMDTSAYHTSEIHQAFHHYIKVVSTHFPDPSATSSKGKKAETLYQFIEQSQIVKYSEDDVPEARFSYDISPMSVIVKTDGLKWYDYLTSLFAIIGGTFTTLGLIDASLYKVFKPKKL